MRSTLLTRLVPHATATVALVASVLAACASKSTNAADDMPVDPVTGLRAADLGPVPPLPDWPDNPPSDAKQALGKLIFSDIRISGSGTAACGNCHAPGLDFMSGTPLDVPDRSFPKLGPALPRNTPSLLNVVYAKMLRWDGSYFTDVFDVAVLPYAEANMNLSHYQPSDDVEAVDVPGSQAAMFKKLTSEIPGYVPLFKDAFGKDITTLTPAEVWRMAGMAIATYLRTVVSRDSAYDRWNAGDASAMTDAAVRGLKLFRGKALCVACHSGPMFSDFKFHNVSTSPPDASGKRADEGRFKVTKVESDRGAFLTPMLRSVGRTSPYFHDGSQTGIANVIRTKLGQKGTLDPNHDPALDHMPDLTDGEIDDLVQFLKALDGADLPAADLQPLAPSAFPK